MDLDKKYKTEAILNGIEYLGDVFNDDGTKSVKKLYKLACGCEKQIRPSHVRDGRFVCINCRPSRKEYLKKYRQENKEILSEYNKKYYSENSEKFKNDFREYYKNNSEKIKEKRSNHYRNNKSNYLFYSRTRKACQKSRTPSWLSKEHKQQILTFYKEAKRLSSETGITYHVDHIVPLQGKLVCGLHVPWNLQIIPAKDNLTKSNKHE